MAKVSANMQKLIEQRDLLLREIEALRNKVAGLEMAIALTGSASQPSPAGKSTASVKNVVLDLLNEVGTTGLTAASATELANRRGISLNPNSVASTLSRFKMDRVVVHDGERYRLPKFAAPGDVVVKFVGSNTYRAI